MEEKMFPKISVIIPAYNLEKLIGKAIGAIIKQDYPELEIIVVDDCSSDGTFVAAETALADCRFEYRIIKHERNRGVAAARNTGIDSATGVFFAFFDGDDFCDTNLFSLLYTAADRAGDADVTMCGRKVYYSDTGKIENCPIDDDGTNWSSSPQLAARAKIMSSYEVSICTLYKTEFIRCCGIRNHEGCRAGEDGEFFLKALVRAKSCAVVRECPYVYVEHPAMGSKNFNRRVRVERYGDNALALERCCRYIEKYSSDENLLNINRYKLYPETLFRLSSYAAMNDDEETFTKIRKETPFGVFLGSWHIFFDKPEYFLKAILFLLLPKLYYAYYRRKRP
ncbi:glycosyltransferase family 2 protein [Cloacibacillus porcorum]